MLLVSSYPCIIPPDVVGHQLTRSFLIFSQTATLPTNANVLLLTSHTSAMTVVLCSQMHRTKYALPPPPPHQAVPPPTTTSGSLIGQGRTRAVWKTLVRTRSSSLVPNQMSLSFNQLPHPNMCPDSNLPKRISCSLSQAMRHRTCGTTLRCGCLIIWKTAVIRTILGISQPVWVHQRQLDQTNGSSTIP
jgi:hypothetical protein